MALLLRDARAIVQRMKRDYETFEKLDAAITAVEQADGLQAERQGAIDLLDRRILELTAQENELINKVNLLKDQVNNMTAGYRKKSEEMDRDFNAKRVEQANALKTTTKEVEQARAAAKDDMEVLRTDKAALEEAIKTLQAKLASIKASINI